MHSQAQFVTTSHLGQNRRFWIAYACSRCGGVLIAASDDEHGYVQEMYPEALDVDELIPEPAHSYLSQALDSLHAPAGSVMLSASAVDAMLKAKGYNKGTLNQRIDQAAQDHLITSEMAKWAHDVRLDANEPRHADESAPLPSDDDAKRSLSFSMALGEFLFVLPGKVRRGLRRNTEPEDAA
jgi:hypothetical protein